MDSRSGLSNATSAADKRERIRFLVDAEVFCCMALPGRGKSAVQLSQPSAPGSVADDPQHISTSPSSFYSVSYHEPNSAIMTYARPAHAQGTVLPKCVW